MQHTYGLWNGTDGAFRRQKSLPRSPAAMSRLTIITGARVDRIVIESGRATGVSYVQRRRRRIRSTPTAKYSMAAGTYNSAKLLMLSGIGPADHLREHGIDVTPTCPASAPICRTITRSRSSPPPRANPAISARTRAGR
jgi:choline dehydrogenase